MCQMGPTWASWMEGVAKVEAPRNGRPDCNTCANRGKVDGLSQETHCEHCQRQQQRRTDHYAPNKI
jgi:hypothetical protein